MPDVLCGLRAFSIPGPLTAAGVAEEFTKALDPALLGAGCAVEVYRLQRLEPGAELAADDEAVCRLPAWSFDAAALEETLAELEHLRARQDAGRLRLERAEEALLALSAGFEEALAASVVAGTAEATAADAAAAAEAVRAAWADEAAGGSACLRARSVGEGGGEVQMLRRQLALSERQAEDTKATVAALRGEFMRLVDAWKDAGGKNLEDVLSSSHAASTARQPRPSGPPPGSWEDFYTRGASGPQPQPTPQGRARRPAGSPLAAPRSPGGTVRPGTRGARGPGPGLVTRAGLRQRSGAFYPRQRQALECS